MSNLSKEVPVPNESVNDENSSSSRVMLITLLLLIAGLLMTGTMMLYYANAHRGDLAQTTETENPTQTDTAESSFFEKMKPKPRVTDSGTTKTNPDKGVMDQLFGGRNNSSVKWPKLKLTGFGSATDGSGGFAIINNNQYRQGDLINGKVKLIEIRKHDVLMEYEGETNTLAMYVTN